MARVMLIFEDRPEDKVAFWAVADPDLPESDEDLTPAQAAAAIATNLLGDLMAGAKTSSDV